MTGAAEFIVATRREGERGGRRNAGRSDRMRGAVGECAAG
jgi:hypothetical protein